MQNEELYKEVRKWKKIAISLTLFVVISVISVVSFILGKESAENRLINVPVSESDQRLVLSSEADNPASSSEKVETPTSTDGLLPTLSEPETSPNQKPTKRPAAIPTVDSKEIVLTPEKRIEGFRSSNGSGSTNSNIRAGRDNELVTRAFLSFDITDIPEGVEIISSELRVFQTKTLGNPYKVGGNLLIDHLNYGDSLDGSDFSTPALLSNFEIFSDKPTTGWRKVDVTNQVINDLVSARPSTQFRIHFEKEIIGGDENGDFAYFESSENTQHSGNTPELVIEYTL